MLMFFTLGASMVGDVCDEDELNTGTRSEGTYYSVYWWFIKMGTAFASFVTGALLVFTCFDETQNVTVDTLGTSVAVIRSEAELWLADEVNSADRIARLDRQLDENGLRRRELEGSTSTIASPNTQSRPSMSDGWSIVSTTSARKPPHCKRIEQTYVAAPATLVAEADAILAETPLLKQQAPLTLFRLRLVEIGLPLVLSIVSIWLTLRYPLTEARCYEIKEALKKRRAESAT